MDYPSKLNPNALEFRPSAALPPPLQHLYHPVFFVSSFIPPPPPPPPPSQRPVVPGSSRPTRLSSSRDRLEVDGGFTMRRRGINSSNTSNNSFSYSKTRSDYRQRMSSNNSSVTTWRKLVRSPPVPRIPTGHETTVMLRNIPNEFTRRRLIHFLDDFCIKVNNKKKSNHPYGDGDGDDDDDDDACGDEESSDVVAFDFVYLPIDFRTKLNKGYAFVNLTSPKGVEKLKEENLKDQTWGYGDSIRKRREIALAKIQGKNALLEHFEQSRFMCESDDYLPVCFTPPRDGSHNSITEQRNIGYRYH